MTDTTIFGIPCNELTDEQINKVYTDKLITLLNVDTRIENILSARMVADLSGDQVDEYRHLGEKWLKYPQLTKAYNTLLDLTNGLECRVIDRYYYYRQHYLFWVPLRDDRKLKEVERFLNEDYSIVTSDNVDYTWLDANHPELSRKVITFILSHEKMYNKSGTVQILKTASKALLEENKEYIFKLNNDYRLKLLSNPNVPEPWLDELLRIYAKKVKYNVPQIECPIKSSVLNALPPVTRLEVIERIIYRNSGEQIMKALPDVKTQEDFNVLLFGALTRHSSRVTKAAESFKHKVIELNVT